MILPPNSSLQATKSPGSVGLLQWDVLGAKMALLAALLVQELFSLALSSTALQSLSAHVAHLDNFLQLKIGQNLGRILRGIGIQRGRLLKECWLQLAAKRDLGWGS